MKNYHICSSIFVKIILLILIYVIAPRESFSHPRSMMHQNIPSDEREFNWGWGRGMGSWRGMYQCDKFDPDFRRGPCGWMNQNLSISLENNLFDLELSKDQKIKIREIFRRMRKEMFDAKERLFDASEELSEIYNQDLSDLDKIGSAYDNIYKIKKGLFMLRIKTQNEIKNLLSEDQQKNFKIGLPFFPRQLMNF